MAFVIPIIMIATSAISAGAMAYMTWQAKDSQDKADAAAKKADEQSKKDAATAKAQAANYQMLSYASLGISVVSLIIFAYMVFRRPV